MTAVVAAGHPATAQAAAAMLTAGGNAVDAALAGAAMACVAEPVLASLGGGGFLLATTNDGGTTAFDFFAQTPRNKNADGVLEEVHADFGPARQAFHVGAGSIATPGMAPGMAAIHGALGSLPLADIVAPAVAAARDGVPVTAFQAKLFEVVAPIYVHSAAARAVFASFGGAGRLPQAGDRLALPTLADSLALLGAEGAAPFVDGEVAAAMCAAARDDGHLMADDLRGYQVARREGLAVVYRGADVWLNPPPASGGLLVGFGLGLLDGLAPPAAFGDGDHGTLLREILRLTGQARAATGVDAALLDPDLLASYRAQVVGRPAAPRGTTHISVIDGDGRAAAMSLSNGEGCGLMAAGFMVNNMLGEADLAPGGSAAGLNQWATDTRMASMMTPTVVRRADGTLAALGSGGSNRIRSAMLQVLINLLDFGMSPEAAVNAPRLHVEGDAVDAEPGLAVAGDVKVWPAPSLFFGGVHVAMRQPDGTVAGCGDPRRDGVWKPVTASSA